MYVKVSKGSSSTRGPSEGFELSGQVGCDTWGDEGLEGKDPFLDFYQK